jgi:hypothetical protein
MVGLNPKEIIPIFFNLQPIWIALSSTHQLLETPSDIVFGVSFGLGFYDDIFVFGVTPFA